MTEISTYETPLWRRIAVIDFDDKNAELTFSSRLARENRWSESYAKRAVEEYKRFAYLAVAAGHDVTPSDEVDQVWHLHLTYTRHYWDVFCKALGVPLHHGPTAGGSLENRRYRDNYTATLASYETAFGAPPPADIWPPSEARFAAAPFMARLNTAEHLIVPRKIAQRAGAALAATGAGGALIASAAAADNPAQSVVERLLSVPPAFWLVVAIVGVSLALAARAGKGKRKRSKRSDGDDGMVAASAGGGSGGKTKEADEGSGCSSGCGGD